VLPNPEYGPLAAAAHDLGDEAAAQIADWLIDLALAFENAHLSQIRRHRQALRPAPACAPSRDPQQLELFDPF